MTQSLKSGPCIHELKSDILRGIYSNLDEWKGFGSELANEGFEVYLIELTGGPEAEAKDAYDYTYEHLSDNVFPDYINTIINDSGSNKLKYVGHSNGCRVALTGIKDNGLKNNFETFVGLGCPVMLNEMTGITGDIRIIKEGALKSQGHIAIDELRNEEKKHIFRQEYTSKLTSKGYAAITFDKISVNLQDFYNDLYINPESTFEVYDVADKHILFAGNGSYYLGTVLKNFNGDSVVPIADLRHLNNQMSNSKLYIHRGVNHGELTSNKYNKKC